jgi:HAD superfamily hydrolase (TIGR01458 family)
MIRGVLLDISRVIYQGSEAIPGAPEAVERLRAAGLPVRFLTNTTRQPRRQVVERLHRMGVDVKSEDVLTPATIARAWLEEAGYAPHLLVHPDLEVEFDGCDGSGKRAVIIGDAGPLFTYERLNAAFREIQAGAQFLALAANRVFRDADGELSLDAGAFVRALEYATGVEARVLGKPAPAFFETAAARFSCSLSQVAMVGDDAESDVAGALAAGLGYGILVRSGKYRNDDESSYQPRPSAVADDLPAAVAVLLDRVRD